MLVARPRLRAGGRGAGGAGSRKGRGSGQAARRTRGCPRAHARSARPLLRGVANAGTARRGAATCAPARAPPQRPPGRPRPRRPPAPRCRPRRCAWGAARRPLRRRGAAAGPAGGSVREPGGGLPARASGAGGRRAGLRTRQPRSKALGEWQRSKGSGSGHDVEHDSAPQQACCVTASKQHAGHLPSRQCKAEQLLRCWAATPRRLRLAARPGVAGGRTNARGAARRPLPCAHRPRGFGAWRAGRGREGRRSAAGCPPCPSATRAGEQRRWGR